SPRGPGDRTTLSGSIPASVPARRGRAEHRPTAGRPRSPARTYRQTGRLRPAGRHGTRRWTGPPRGALRGLPGRGDALAPQGLVPAVVDRRQRVDVQRELEQQVGDERVAGQHRAVHVRTEDGVVVRALRAVARAVAPAQGDPGEGAGGGPEVGDAL